MTYRIPRKKYSSGFTLVEMLVSMALFAVTVTVGMGSLLVLVDANARSQAVQVAVTNISFALDSITRQLRTGTDWHCRNGGPIAPGKNIRSGVSDCSKDSALAFTDTRTGWRYAYELNGTSLQRIVEKSGTGSGEWQSVTGQNLRIETFEVTMTGTDDADNNQPTATIFIKAEVGDVAGLGTTLEIQTSVTQRKTDL